ncbi:MAG: S8 family peptidase [Bacteroidia bacterium]|nr:S8 family peptidase [Bacteroidia bacterium]
MINYKLVFTKVLTLVILFFTTATYAQQIAKYASNRIIAKFKAAVPAAPSNAKASGTGIASLDALNAKFSCSAIEKMLPEIQGTDALHMNNLAILHFSSDQNIPNLVNQYMSTGLFDYVEPDYIGSCDGVEGIDLVANDTYFNSRQWSMQNKGTFSDSPSKSGADIKMVPGWDITTGSANVIIGIIDTGTKLDHPEFSGRIWVNPNEIAGNGVDDDGNGYKDDTNGGWDFTNNDNSPADDNGHGTNVTGILGANGNNSSLYAGVNWKSKLIIVKALDAGGSGSYSNWIKGINYCIAAGARVINMSLGGNNSSQSLQDAITAAYQNQVVCVVAMGNDNTSTPEYPANCTNVLAVGATNSMDQRCNPFSGGSGGSNYGSNIKVCAPGNIIYGLRYNSNTSSSYYYSGTSQATPHAAGLASLLFSQNTSRTAETVMSIIENTADDQVGLSTEDKPGWDQYYGYGRINAYKALTYVATGIDRSAVVGCNSVKIYPNPFTSNLSIAYQLSKPADVKIEIADILGQRINIINKGTLQPDSYIDGWSANDFPSGIYFVTVILNNSEKQSYKVVKN